MSSFQPFALLLYGLSSVHGVLGLTTRYCLYFDNKELASNNTSLALHFNFLMATILDHRLVFLPLSELTTTITTWARNRRVERGSRLVCVVPRHSKTVLQMPRGNLEVT
jgi:elongator complex protein 1